MYDIPIHKHAIQNNNFVTPSIHPSIYPARATKSKAAASNFSSKKKERINLLQKAFGGIDKLAEHNLCNQLIDAQARLDLDEFLRC